MILPDLIEPAILGIASFTLVGVINLKIEIAKVIERLNHADDKMKEHNHHTQRELDGIKLEVNEIWEFIRGEKL